MKYAAVSFVMIATNDTHIPCINRLTHESENIIYHCVDGQKIKRIRIENGIHNINKQFTQYTLAQKLGMIM